MQIVIPLVWEEGGRVPIILVLVIILIQNLNKATDTKRKLDYIASKYIEKT